MEADVQRVSRDFWYLNEPGSEGEGYNRLAYPAEEREARRRAGLLMAELGLEVWADRYGNLIGWPPEAKVGPVALTGSHLDTVPQGGPFDGAAGVAASLAAVRMLREENPLLPVGVVVFAAEESSRFSRALLGSRGFSGEFTLQDEELIRDRDGNSLAEILVEEREFLQQNFHLLPGKPPVPAAFLELHIEQGPALENENLSLGLVKKIAAPTRFSVKFRGDAGHSGATPMDLRRDALAAAGRLITSIEELCRQHGRLLEEDSLVGTVGDLRVNPGAMNVVPGEVELLVDIRSTSGRVKTAVVDMVYEYIDDLVRQRELDHEVTVLEDRNPVPMDAELVRFLEEACQERHVAYRTMFSGAGHDAMQMGTICPAGLLFVPCQRGLSHNPHEWAELSDVTMGAAVMAGALAQWAGKLEENPPFPSSEAGG